MCGAGGVANTSGADRFISAVAVMGSIQLSLVNRAAHRAVRQILAESARLISRSRSALFTLLLPAKPEKADSGPA